MLLVDSGIIIKSREPLEDLVARKLKELPKRGCFHRTEVIRIKGAMRATTPSLAAGPLRWRHYMMVDMPGVPK